MQPQSYSRDDRTFTRPPAYQGYVDERSVRHVAGWVRNLSDAAQRLDVELVVSAADGERVLHRGRADGYSGVLVQVGVGDGRYAFRHVFESPLTVAERDALFVRPIGSTHRLELAPAIRTDPPLDPGRCDGSFQGYLDERSQRHVAGWVRNLADPAERVAVEVVLPTGPGERVLWSGTADRFSTVLRQVGVGDGGYSFYVLLPEELSEAERDRLLVRPAGSDFRLELAPALRTRFEPISHVALDIVDNCNLRCPFCVYDYANTYRTQFMTEETFFQALRLIPFVTDGNFWLSCLHEATLHPRLLDFIQLVPARYRSKLFYTTNLARRMPRQYFAAVAQSGMHHLNISVESLVPAIYERMRKGARHPVFQENWDRLLEAFCAASAPPRVRYNVMAYRSNFREIPALAATLLAEKSAWQVEIRHTFDEPHIPTEFRDTEFLTTGEWAWLAEQLRSWPPDRVVLLLPPGGRGVDDAPARAQSPTAGAPAAAGGSAVSSVPRPLNISMAWDGTMRVYGEAVGDPGQAPKLVNYAVTKIGLHDDPLEFLLAL